MTLKHVQNDRWSCVLHFLHLYVSLVSSPWSSRAPNKVTPTRCELHSCRPSKQPGRGQTDKRAESLFNAVCQQRRHERSQKWSVAMQPQPQPHSPTPPHRYKCEGQKQTFETLWEQQTILQGELYSTCGGSSDWEWRRAPVFSCSVCEWCNSLCTVGRNDSGPLRAHSH